MRKYENYDPCVYHMIYAIGYLLKDPFYFYFFIIFLKFTFNLAYSTTMVSGLDSLMPLTHLANLTSHNPSNNPLFVLHI